MIYDNCHLTYFLLSIYMIYVFRTMEYWALLIMSFD